MLQTATFSRKKQGSNTSIDVRLVFGIQHLQLNIRFYLQLLPNQRGNKDFHMRMTVPGEGLMFMFAPVFDNSNRYASYLEIQSVINARIQDGKSHRRNDAAIAL